MEPSKSQYLGENVSTEPAAPPDFTSPLVGKYVTLETVQPHHIAPLMKGLGLPEHQDRYTLMGVPVIKTTDDLSNHVYKDMVEGAKAIVLVIKANASALTPPAPSPPDHDRTDILGFLAIAFWDLRSRTVEIGAAHGPALGRSAAATEAHYLLLRQLMDAPVPYRRVAWKTNALNVKSRRWAERIGFTHEGTWRKAAITAWGTSRDTAWYAIIDDDWGRAKVALERWLDEENFDGEGGQKVKLEVIRETLK